MKQCLAIAILLSILTNAASADYTQREACALFGGMVVGGLAAGTTLIVSPLIALAEPEVNAKEAALGSLVGVAGATALGAIMGLALCGGPQVPAPIVPVVVLTGAALGGIGGPFLFKNLWHDVQKDIDVGLSPTTDGRAQAHLVVRW